MKRRLRSLGLAGGLLALAAPVSVLGQSRLIEARARIDATVAAVIRVEIDYVVNVDEADGGGGAIPLEGLAFRPSRVESVVAWIDGTPVEVVLESTGVGRLIGSVSIGRSRSGRVPLRVAYEVTQGFEGDDPYRIRIPILAIGWPAADALPGVFEAEALFSSELKVFEAFPSGLIQAGVVGSVGRFVLELPAVPALISMRATSGPLPFGGLVQMLDGLVLLALLATAVLGWRHFRGTA